MNDSEQEQSGGMCLGCNVPRVINSVDLCRICADELCPRCKGTNESPDMPDDSCCACEARNTGAPADVVERLQYPWLVKWTDANGPDHVWRSDRACADATADRMTYARSARDVSVSYLAKVGQWPGVRTPTTHDTIGD